MGMNQSKPSASWGRLHRRLTVLGLFSGFAAGVWAVDAPENPVGLQGIMPAEVPAGLQAEEFAALDGNWADWSSKTSEAVTGLFKWTGSAEEQQAALDAVQARVATMEKALGDARYRSLHAPLANLSARLGMYADLGEAMLATLALDPQAARNKHLDQLKASLSTAATGLESDLATVSGGSAWGPFAKLPELKAALASGNSESLAAAAKATHDKIASRDKLTDESQKAFLNRDAFTALAKAAAAYATAATTPAPENPAAQLRPLFGELLSAATQWQATGESAAAAKVRDVFRQIRAISPDGGDLLAAALQKHVFNFNLRIVASEEFLSRLLSEARTESSQVRDYVLGASVGGNQTTTTNLGVDLKPDNSALRFNLVLNGVVRSSTAGATSQATIYTSGYHTFNSVKGIRFNGTSFETFPATISVAASNTTTGATTSYSGGLFGGMAERIAMREAAARRPQSEAIARQRVSDRVLPRFNSEVDSSFANAATKLEDELWTRLRGVGLEPDAKQFQSTETEGIISTRLMSEGELGGNSPNLGMVPAVGATGLIHESLINNSVDRIGLAGQTLSDEQLSAQLEEFLTKAFGREVKFPKRENVDEEAASTSFVFAEQDPIRINITASGLQLVFRTGFQREGRDPIPETEITVPLTFEIGASDIVIRADQPQVAGSASIATRAVIRKKIQSSLPDRTVARQIKIKGEKKEVPANITGIQMLEGWAVVTVQ